MTIYWKTMAGICVYRSDNGLSIHQNFRYRWLIFHNQTKCLQTLIHRSHPYKPVLTYIKPFTYAARLQPGQTCLLGLGGGAVAHYLSKYLATYSLTAVEISDHIIDLAAEYFMINGLKNLAILHNDAHIFVSQSTQYFQHILIDVCSSAGYPEQCAHQDFFMNCKQLLVPNGVLALNLTHFSQELTILRALQIVFQYNTVCIPVKGTTNMIVLACHSRSILMDLLQHHNSTIKKLIWDSQFGYMADIRF